MAAEHTHNPEYEPESLMADLAALVDFGWIKVIRQRGEPSRYAPTDLGQRLLSTISGGVLNRPHSFEEAEEMPAWPEPCPNPGCGATDGFDGGNRCLRCGMPWPPEM